MSDNWREVQFRVRCTAASAVFLVLVFISIWAVATDVSVTIQIAQLPDYLDPAKISTFEEKLICGAVYETLLDYDPENGISKGALAEQWKVDATGTVYTFTLQKEACFHNSKTVSAGDVKFSWERLSDPETSGYGYLLNNVQGAKDVLNGKCSHVEGIKIVNAHTLQVTLLEPDYTFPALVSSPALGIVCQDYVQKQGKSYGKTGTGIIGTGAFRLSSWSKKGITLIKNGRYSRKAPYMGKLEFTATGNQQEIKGLFQDGKVDILAGITPQFAISYYSEGDGNTRANLVEKPVLSLYFLGFNMEQSPFGDQVELRCGVNSMLDKDKMALVLLGEGGKALHGLLPQELLGDSDQLKRHVFDKDKALKLLTSAGYPYGSRLSPLALAYNDSPGHEYMARLVQENLGQGGIAIVPQKRPWKEYQEELKDGRYPFFRLGWDADYPEPGNLLSCNFKSGAQDYNFTRYNNEKFDFLLKNARGEQDFRKRQQFYRQAEELIISELPVIPLFQRVALFVVQDEIRGFHADLLGRIDFNRLDKSPKRK